MSRAFGLVGVARPVRCRLVARHIASGKEPDAARAWAAAVDAPDTARVLATAGEADLRVSVG